MARAKRETIGRLAVGQSGGCTHVINSSLVGVVEAALGSRRIGGVWGMRHGIEGALQGDFIDLAKETPEALRAVARTPAAALGSCRHKITDDEADDLVARFEKEDIGAFVYIGGNDSADTAHRVAQAARRREMPLRVVSVPKTIDNDLPHTHHSPGFGSAGRFLAAVTADTGMETEAMRTVEPVKVIEAMGRNAGWLACASALAKRSERDAPQLVWPPEVPFDRAKLLSLVGRRLDRLGYCVLVIGETVRDGDGRPIGAAEGTVERDAFGHPRVTGAAQAACEIIADRFGVRARWDKPGTIQRMSSAHFSPTDLREARQCGRWAVRFALRGRTDCMVIMRNTTRSGYRIGYGTVPVEEVANREKLLPASFFNRDRMLPTAAFRRYALPLVGDDLPQHARLSGGKVRSRRR